MRWMDIIQKRMNLKYLISVLRETKKHTKIKRLLLKREGIQKIENIFKNLKAMSLSVYIVKRQINV